MIFNILAKASYVQKNVCWNEIHVHNYIFLSLIIRFCKYIQIIWFVQLYLILWKNICYINFWLQIPMWFIVYNTQNSFAPQIKNVKLRWGKKKHLFFLFECPGSALLIDTNFTYEKSMYPFQLKSMYLWTFTNDLSWILLIDVWCMYKEHFVL